MARAAFEILLVLASTLVLNCAAFNNVGCLYVGNLCESDLEWCHNDDAFGRCLPLHVDPSTSPYRHVLNEPELVALEAALDELHQSGYKWSDTVTQCVLQRLFDTFQYKKPIIPDICYDILQETNDNEEEEGENDDNDLWMDQQLADENTNQLLPQKRFFPQIIRSKGRIITEAGPVDNSNEDFIDRLKEILDSEQDSGPVYDSYSDLVNDDDSFRLSLPSAVFTNPKFERQERLDVKKPGPLFSVNNFAFQRSDIQQPARSSWAQQDWVPIFDQDYVYESDDELKSQEEKKEPGRIDSENLRRMAVQKLVDRMAAEETVQPIDDKAKPNLVTSNSAETAKVVKVAESQAAPLDSEKKFPVDQDGAQKGDSDKQYQVVDASYAYIGIKGSFKTWKQGANLVRVLSQLLEIPHDAFADVRVEENQVIFRVLPNEKGLTASIVATRADEMRDRILEATGLEVDVTGIGDQSKISSTLYREPNNQELFITITLCVLVATILSAAVALFVLRRRYQAQQKLKGLAHSGDSEATRDYQDLCRARMATKSPAPIFEAAKESPKMPLIATSRDSESSRSSTSSWCEEPVVTNMDISTGHMVLTYMEDHLRNKDRLDQEWQALCAYEAEPSTSTLAASKPENNTKNRCSDVLPYDHSRVVLNTLGNEEGSDYINASAIADHDPRHPAYIAAQAPLAGTVVDFWQMIWEQGSVVLVLLTKVTENGQEMCHIYWPEEGSERYNYFEVHLVSEHIWCDDYLVRSFYLKNLRTGETRTVTQFHFLSWPENGVPLSTKALLEFRRKVNKSYRGRSCPIVVHCSDGAGRTGTYCLIDMVLHRMAKGAREIDIAATLEHLRDQRPRAVRTKQQFEFVLTAVAEEVHAILRALPQ